MALIDPVEKGQANEIAQAVYNNFEEKAGSVPEWVKVMAHRPEILKNFVSLFGSIMESGKIERSLKWKIAYTVSNTLRCEFCVDVTSKMLKKMGATEEEMDNIKNLNSVSDEEKEILEMVKDITLDGNLDSPEILAKMKEKMSEAELVELISVIGLFNYINRFNNAFVILPE